MDLTPFLIRSPLNHGLGRAKTILVEYGVRPAQKDGLAAYDRVFTEETCILTALVNGFNRVVILNYPHKSHFKNGIHEPHPNHITAAFGHRGDKIEKAHIYLSEVRPFIVCRREEDEKIDVVWGGHLGYTFEPVLSFVVEAWLDSTDGSATGLKWETVRVNETRRKLKTTGILNLDSWRTTAAEINKDIAKERDPQSDWFRYGMGKGIRDSMRTTITTPDKQVLTLQDPGHPTPPPVWDFLRARGPESSINFEDFDPKRKNPFLFPKSSMGVEKECKDFILPHKRLASRGGNAWKVATDRKDFSLPHRQESSSSIQEDVAAEVVHKDVIAEGKEDKGNISGASFKENKENDTTLKDFTMPHRHKSSCVTPKYAAQEDKENKESLSKADCSDENKENESLPKPKPKPRRVQPLRTSRTSQNSQGGNWRDTMNPLPRSPEKKEDPWRALQRLCNDMPSFAKGKENDRTHFRRRTAGP